jgi:hypothetical protein
MFCSLKVEPKNAVDLSREDSSSDKRLKSMPRSEWEEFLDVTASEWLKDRPRIPIARNVGGGRKQKWTPMEDAALRVAVAQFGSEDWRNVALLVPGRSSKQCHERWIGHLAPENTTRAWSADEDRILVKNQVLLGNHWAKIKTLLPGRSMIAVKNRWNWLRRRDVPNHSDEFQAIAESHCARFEREIRGIDLTLPEREGLVFDLWTDQDFSSLLS